MADTRTISDEETTLDQLTEKSSLANSDLFLTRNSANTDYKVKFETLKDTLIGGDVAAGNTKAVSGSAVNSALTDLSEIKTIVVTDVNNAIPSANNKTEFFSCLSSASNVPVASHGFIKCTRRTTDPNGSSSNYVTFITQEFTTYDATTPKNYVRSAYAPSNSTNFTFTNWEQVATTTTVNTTLADYFKVPLKQMNINSPYCDSAKNKLYYYRIGDLITIKGNFTAKIDNPAWNGVFVTANTNLKPQTAQTIKDLSGKDTLYIYTDGRIQNSIALVKDTSYYFEFTYIAN